ncbi:MAG: sec-independent protein translocase protein TatA [Mycobacteriales bacterium]|jgi:sec-independent protein translocase protein TatA
MGELSVWHWLIVGAVAMMMFGANRLPDIARSVGRSMRIFQAEMRGIQNDGGTQVVDGAAGGTPAAPADAGPVAAGPAGGGAGTDGAAREGGPRRPGAQ